MQDKRGMATLRKENWKRERERRCEQFVCKELTELKTGRQCTMHGRRNGDEKNWCLVSSPLFGVLCILHLERCKTDSVNKYSTHGCLSTFEVSSEQFKL